MSGVLSETIKLLLRDPGTPDYVLRDAIHDEVHERGLAVASVYVVYRHSGSYSDYRETMLAAFLDKDEADKLLAECVRWAEEYWYDEKWYQRAAAQANIPHTRNGNPDVYAYVAADVAKKTPGLDFDDRSGYRKAVAALPGHPDPGLDESDDVGYGMYEIQLRG